MNILDPLYGRIEFDPALQQLAALPIVQRLRHISLSNIDSVSLPGIAGTKRYEHVLGVAYLSTQLGLLRNLKSFERSTLAAAAMLHDWAIGPFGHLLEEAANYAGIHYDHERKLENLLAPDGSGNEIGGSETQILAGKQTNLRPWATKTFAGEANEALLAISKLIVGEGSLGQLISGQIDIDNLDNVTRVAFHMGLEVDRKAPWTIATGLIEITPDGLFVFTPVAVDALTKWVRLREEVYQHLMVATPDFAAKAMIIHAAADALGIGALDATSWKLIESDFIAALLRTEGFPRVAIERWLVGDYWVTSPLVWFEDNAPTLHDLARLDKELSIAFKKKCLSYRITDKRYRQITIALQSGERVTIGAKSKRWLLGVTSPEKLDFTAKERAQIVAMTESMFSTRIFDRAGPNIEASLF